MLVNWKLDLQFAERLQRINVQTFDDPLMLRFDREEQTSSITEGEQGEMSEWKMLLTQMAI